MNPQAQHIVHQLIVEIETNSKEKGYSLKDNAAGFISGSLSPVLEALFDELEKKLQGRVLSIDNLTVDVTSKTSDLNYGEISRLIEQAIREEINKPVSPRGYHQEQSTNGESVMPKSQRELQSVFHFLKTGSRPWWITDNASFRELMEHTNLLELSRTETETLVNELSHSNPGSFVKRLLLQIPETVLVEWFARSFHFPEEFSGLIPSIPAVLQSSEIKEAWWELLLNIFRDYSLTGNIKTRQAANLLSLTSRQGKTSKLEVQDFLEIISGRKISIPDTHQVRTAVNNQEPLLDKPAEKTALSSLAAEQSGYYIPAENAGLIILHPFLTPFFTGIGLLKDNQLTDPELAVHTLHYLATGHEKSMEFDLQFEKFLCGIPFEVPIRRDLELPEAIKLEATKMLKAVLVHWDALKSDSPELLRFEFLQREAKIIVEEYQTTRLVFERKAQDILLDKLPWNLGVVKIDWRKDLLFVEW